MRCIEKGYHQKEWAGSPHDIIGEIQGRSYVDLNHCFMALVSRVQPPVKDFIYVYFLWKLLNLAVTQSELMWGKTVVNDPSMWYWMSECPHSSLQRFHICLGIPYTPRSRQPLLCSLTQSLYMWTVAALIVWWNPTAVGLWVLLFWESGPHTCAFQHTVWVLRQCWMF